MRTYKDSRGDLKEIQKDSELKVQRNLWKIREDPGEIQIDCGKILKILNREIQRDLLKILGAIRGIIGEIWSSRIQIGYGNIEIESGGRYRKMRKERCKEIHGRYREIWRRFRKICQIGG
jgi:hypothetical protein